MKKIKYILLLIPSLVYSQTKISEMPLDNTVNGEEYFPIVESGANKRMTLTTVMNSVGDTADQLRIEFTDTVSQLRIEFQSSDGPTNWLQNTDIGGNIFIYAVDTVGNVPNTVLIGGNSDNFEPSNMLEVTQGNAYFENDVQIDGGLNVTNDITLGVGNQIILDENPNGYLRLTDVSGSYNLYDLGSTFPSVLSENWNLNLSGYNVNFFGNGWTSIASENVRLDPSNDLYLQPDDDLQIDTDVLTINSNAKIDNIDTGYDLNIFGSYTPFCRLYNMVDSGDYDLHVVGKTEFNIDSNLIFDIEDVFTINSSFSIFNDQVFINDELDVDRIETSWISHDINPMTIVTTSYINLMGDSLGINGDYIKNWNEIASLVDLYDENNVYVGDSALHDITTGIDNAAVGYRSLRNNTSGNENIAIGNEAMFLNETGFSNTALGVHALRNSTGGNFNMAIGESSMHDLTTGDQNVGLGFQTLYSNNGNYNVAFGNQSGRNSSGSFNNFFGYNTGRNTTGLGNIFIGNECGYNNTSGSNNVFIGYYSGIINTVGNNNVYIGSEAGYNSTGSNNVFIGYDAGSDEIGSNLLYIANSNTTSPLLYGDFSNDSLAVNGDLTTTGSLTINLITEVWDSVQISSSEIVNGDSIILVDSEKTVLTEIIIDYQYLTSAYTSNSSDSVLIKTKVGNDNVNLAYISNEFFLSEDSKYTSTHVNTVDTDGEYYWLQIPSGKYIGGGGSMNIYYKYKKLP